MAGEDAPRTGAASLQAHDNVDIALSEELFAPGCALCRHRSSQGRRYLKNLVYEGVNDVGFRRTLDQARGFCAPHTVALFEADRDEMGGALGTAILLESVLRHRLEELGAADGELRRDMARRLTQATLPAACPVCAIENEAVGMAAARLIEWMLDDAWRDAVAASPLCLPDVLILARGATTSEERLTAARPVLLAQLARLARLRDALADFAHDSTYDRHHRLTPEQHAAAGLATEALGGTVAWEWRHRRGHSAARRGDG